MTGEPSHGGYVLEDGIYRPPGGVQHRPDEYDPAAFEALRAMQSRHFWYRGRERFLREGYRRTLRREQRSLAGLRCIDLGGGCGGWVQTLLAHQLQGRELALADSSLEALGSLAPALRDRIDRYQVDLLQLHWRERWDVAFLFDVLEHIPDDLQVLREIHAALTPGGLLLLTTPALQKFWTYNDELAHHVRRYSRGDLRERADRCGFEVLDLRYFMFLLSPLLLASRWGRRVQLSQLSTEERRALLIRTHQTPNPVVNTLLGAIFAAETPLGHAVPFPWGTSLYAVLRKPGLAA